MLSWLVSLQTITFPTLISVLVSASYSMLVLLRYGLYSFIFLKLFHWCLVMFLDSPTNHGFFVMVTVSLDSLRLDYRHHFYGGLALAWWFGFLYKFSVVPYSCSVSCLVVFLFLIYLCDVVLGSISGEPRIINRTQGGSSGPKNNQHDPGMIIRTQK